MKSQKKVTRPCPRLTANILSRLFYGWLFPLFRLGHQRSLQLTDIFRTPPQDDPVKTSLVLSREWKRQLKSRAQSASIVMAIIKAYGVRYILTSQLLFVAECILRVGQPFMVEIVVNHFSRSTSGITYEHACYATLGICLSSILIAFTRSHYIAMNQVIGMNIRSALNVMVYQKILRLSTSSLEQVSVGYVLNLLANDFNRLDEVCHSLYYIPVAVLQSVIVIYILWGESISHYNGRLYSGYDLGFIGYATLGGIVVLMIFIPIQTIMGRFFRLYRRKSTRLTDKRVKLMSEIINAMKVIKMYCWEKPFGDLVKNDRAAEVQILKWSSLMKAINSALTFIQIRIMLFVTFLVYVYQYNKLDAASVFVTMSLYNAIRIPVAKQLPNAIGVGAETLVALKRVQDLLLMDERSPRHLISRKSSFDEFAVQMRKYSTKWNTKLATNALTNITMTVRRGELVMVVGSVGSGKTCLLNAILNELCDVSGECHVNGSTSYAPQVAWCYSGTVRENILLANEFEKPKFDQVIKACGLARDLDMFPNGDLTIVGEKGYTLSGGQKARIGLARAVYNDADLYLLDDPLSAVDPSVANHIFNNCINGYLKDKTVVLVTHQLQFLNNADKIIILNEGQILTSGTFDQLMEAGVDFLSFLNRSEDELDESKSRAMSNLSSTSNKPIGNMIKKQSDLVVASKQRASSSEKKSVGAVEWSVYFNYLKSGASVPTAVLIILIAVSAQVILVFSDFWLSHWTESYEQQLNLNLTRSNVSDSAEVWTLSKESTNITIYCALIVGLFIIAFARTISIFLLCLNCSRNLHDNVFKVVLRTPMTFFETNPMGRILNRFTRDVGQVDQKIPPTLIDMSTELMNVIGVLVISMTVKPVSIIPAIILLAVAIPYRNFYVRTTRDLKRLDAISKSPVYNHIATTVDGLSTVRAFGFESTFEDQFMDYIQDATSCRFVSIIAQRAVGITLDCFALAYICAVSVFLVALPDGVRGGYAGLVLTSALTLIGMFQATIRQSTEFETQMVSVERLIEYQSIKSEAVLTSSKCDAIIGQWPNEGCIRFDHVFLTYSDNTNPVLSDICLNIVGGEKVGVVGRTGAGKSSLITAIFRLVEPKGVIRIDGVDIKSIGLHELRSKISIIPQDPVLFSGTIRRNLDPFNQFSDNQLWQSLVDSNLDKLIQNMVGQLDGEVTDGGSNLSVGQRQLVCLARALLRNNKILILDEATANVDYETDELIQTTIRTKFTDCTVMTIAHRLNTVIDMDQVLVLDAGQVKEYDAPYLLLEQRGLFYNMVQKTGAQHASMLIDIAKRSFLSKQKLI